ncbi:MAG: hypothetical protein KZQ70_09935 [gamma proteobacterium symbiont of Lucinoma myriamae]|nr:hypothetical protein [gamma proteobacterium symbiont of Lucinoma myriamae]MCU7819756.1 hypothetical protein [gamma proteobacterium symbiont of Lucinoma myriamae]
MRDLSTYATILQDRLIPQLDRYFQETKKTDLIVHDATSFANHFPFIIEALNDDQVDIVRLSPTRLVNPNVDFTLLIEIILSSGNVLSFQAHWTAYKNIRADELVSSVKKVWKKFEDKILLCRESGEVLRPEVDPSLFIQQVFKLIEEDRYTSEEYQKWGDSFI